MVLRKPFYYDSKNGEDRIHAIKWYNDAVPPRAVLQIEHGIAEYIMRYDAFARFIAEKGIIVVGEDHAGHGKSISKPENAGFFAEKDGWNCAVEDIKRLRDLTKTEYPRLPYIIFGHSLGSFLARTYIIDYPYDVDACILSGTGNHSSALCDAGLAVINLAITKTGLRGKTRAVSRIFFGTYNKRIKNKRTVYDWISRDDEAVDKYIADPDRGEIPSNGLIADMLGGIKYITLRKNAERMRKDMPIYLFSGEDDPVGEYGKGVYRACELFFEVGMRDVTLKMYEGGRHEMLNETNKEEVYRDVLFWIESKIAALSE